MGIEFTFFWLSSLESWKIQSKWLLNTFFQEQECSLSNCCFFLSIGSVGLPLHLPVRILFMFIRNSLEEFYLILKSITGIWVFLTIWFLSSSSRPRESKWKCCSSSLSPRILSLNVNVGTLHYLLFQMTWNFSLPFTSQASLSFVTDDFEKS